MFVICVHDSCAIYRIKIFTNAIGINEPTRNSLVASMILRSSGQNPISQMKIFVRSFFSFIYYLVYLRIIELTLFVKFNKYLLTNSLTNLLFMSKSISKSNSEELPKDTEQFY